MKVYLPIVVAIISVCCFNFADSYNIQNPSTAFIHRNGPPERVRRRPQNKGASALVRPIPSTPSPTLQVSTVTTEPEDRNTIPSDTSEKYSTTKMSTVNHQPTTTPKVEASTRKNNCKPEERYHPETDQCYVLRTKGPCEPEQWYIINEESGDAVCKKRPCQSFYGEYKGECVLLLNAERKGICGTGQQLYNNIYGKVSCECRPQHYRWSKDNMCYPSYYRGPCESGQQYIFNDVTNTTECMTNECTDREGFVLIDGECKELGEECGEYGEKNVYINPHTGKPGCFDFFRPGNR